MLLSLKYFYLAAMIIKIYFGENNMNFNKVIIFLTLESGKTSKYFCINLKGKFNFIQKRESHKILCPINVS